MRFIQRRIMRRNPQVMHIQMGYIIHFKAPVSPAQSKSLQRKREPAASKVESVLLGVFLPFVASNLVVVSLLGLDIFSRP